MAKITLSDLANLQNESTATANINANNTAIEIAMENTLSRDGTSPNQMGAVLDMNSNRIINLGTPVENSDAVRFRDLTATPYGVLGTLSSQNSNAVAITGGTITGVSLTSSSVTITGGTLSGVTISTGSLGTAVTAVTQAVDNNSTLLATTAFVLGQAASVASPMDGSATVGTSTRYARQDHVHASDTAKLSLTGGTLSGNLTISKTDPGFTLNKAASGQNNSFVGSTNNLNRWMVIPGDFVSETGSNAGSNFAIYRHNDAGTAIEQSFGINRATGVATFTQTPTAPTVTSGTSDTQLATTQHVMRRSTISIMDYGAVNNGSLTVSGTGTDSRAAFVSAAAATVGTLVRVIVPPGTYRIASNLSLPVGVEWDFLPGAFLCPDTGVTVTFLDRVIAGPYRLFGTNGTILGIRDVIAEWWGAAADGSTDNAPFITKAIACVQGSGSSKGGECKLTLLAGVYAIGGANPLRFTNSPTICWRVKGAGHLATTLLAKSTASGIAVVVTASSISDFRFSDFTVINQTGGSGCSIGVFVEHSAGYHNSLFEDIKVSGFAINWDVVNPTRLVKWDRCSAWAFDNSGVEVASTTNLQIIAASASTFTGDLEFVNCQWVGAMGSSAPSGKDVYLTAGSSSAHVSGIRFFGNIFYGSQYQAYLEASAASQMDDIWFQTCQFEAPVRGVVDTIGIVLNATGASTFIRDIHIDHNYFAGNGHNRHIVGSVTGSSTGGQWLISNNFFNGSISRSVEITGSGGTYTGYVFTGNIQRDCASLGDVNLLTAMNYHSITGNTVSGTTTGTSFFHFTGAGDWYSLAGNNAAGQRTTNYLFDGGAGANRATAANL